MPPETIVWTMWSKLAEQAPTLAVFTLFVGAGLFLLTKGMLIPKATVDRMWAMQDARNQELLMVVKEPIRDLVGVMVKVSDQTTTRTQEATKEHMALLNALNTMQRSMDDLNRRINGVKA
jgi:uncharacterized protein YlxW (UPF0749 family)